MKFIKLTACTLLGMAFCLQTTAQTEEQSKAWQAYMEPGAMHKMMASWDGVWDEEITHWMEPGAEATQSKATCVNKTILGGRYSEARHTGNFFGMPFEGISLLAYDNAKKVFVSTWVDNMGSGVMIMEGTWNPQTKTINFKGKATDPMTGKDMEMRETFRIVDDNKQIMEMYMVIDGKEFKNMAITMTRKK